VRLRFGRVQRPTSDGTERRLAGCLGMQPADTPAPEAPRPEDIDAVGDEANRLEERAEDDGVLPKPAEDDAGVGPQTGVVP
jgi:hypothetical protein